MPQSKLRPAPTTRLVPLEAVAVGATQPKMSVLNVLPQETLDDIIETTISLGIDLKALSSAFNALRQATVTSACWRLKHALKEPQPPAIPHAAWLVQSTPAP